MVEPNRYDPGMKFVAVAILALAIVIAVVGWHMAEHRSSCGGSGIYRHCSR